MNEPYDEDDEYDEDYYNYDYGDQYDPYKFYFKFDVGADSPISDMIINGSILVKTLSMDYTGIVFQHILMVGL